MRRRIGLRWRITVAFIGGALGVSALVAGTTYLLADRYLFRQRVEDSTRQSFGRIRFAVQYLAQTETPSGLSERQQADLATSGLVDLLGTRGTFDALILRGDQPFSSSFSIIPAHIPADLRRTVSRGQVAYAVVPSPRALVFGSPIPGHDLDAYFFYPMSDVDETLRALRNVLLGVSLAAVILATLVGTRVSRRVVVPVRRVSDAARRVAEGLLETRLPAGDRDELGRLADSFNEMAAALEDRIARERRFVGDVSHELRTPLTTLRASTDYLLSNAEGLSGPVRRATELLAADLDYLQRLVDDLLEISRAEAGKVQMSWERINLADLVREVVARRTRADGRVVRVLTNTSRAELTLTADKKRLERVVGNLVDNALVHGGGDPVTVRLSANGGGLRLAVQDRGPGIPASDVPRIFERFFKADPARQREHGRGSGLGLAIARENAHLHGGEIEVESGGGGTTFTLSLPREPEEAAP
jgi:two-component system sensor histidine kinase MtrB